MESPYRIEDGIEIGGLPEDHCRRLRVVAAKPIYHAIDRVNRECAWLCRCKVEIWSVEEHARVPNTVPSQAQVPERSFPFIRSKELMKIIVMPRDALAFLAQHAPPLDHRLKP